MSQRRAKLKRRGWRQAGGHRLPIARRRPFIEWFQCRSQGGGPKDGRCWGWRTARKISSRSFASPRLCVENRTS